MINKNRLKDKAAAFGIEINENQAQQLDYYAEKLVEWNEKINLTAITDPEEIEIKHFLDCLLTVRMYDEGDSVADVGTGAGFPGVVIKIMRPDVKITLIDSLEKRLTFLQEVNRDLSLNMSFKHGRAEDLGHDSALRQSFTATTARAVAPLNVLSEFCLPLTSVGGKLIAMKGRSAENEISLACSAIELLGGKIESQHSFILPDNSEREVIIVRKGTDTPEKYPRRAPVIKKKPL